jgi:hypothetical protein
MSDQKYFLSPKLTGKRFDAHSVPVEILQDFIALQDLIVDLAKDLYLNDNPTRTRVPKGFSEGVSLSLDKIEDGSAILKFLLTSSLLTSNILGENSNQYTYFEKAKNQIIEVVKAAESGGDFDNILSSRYLNYFNKIGRHLKEDEAIFFNHTQNHSGPKFNKSIRNKIILSASGDATYKDSFTNVALLSSIDKVDRTFCVMIDGNKISAKLESTYFKTLIDTFSDYYSNTYLSLEGEGTYNEANKLIKIDSISKLDILDPLDVSFRLSEISKLKDGWYNSQGIAPTPQFLLKFEKFFESNYDYKNPLPSIFPTVEGNIQLEWSINNREISLEVFSNDLSAEYLEYNTLTNNTVEEILNLTEKSGWQILSQKLSVN